MRLKFVHPIKSVQEVDILAVRRLEQVSVNSCATVTRGDAHLRIHEG